jgi:hypothetical protein
MAGLVVGVAAMVTVIGFVRSMTAEINHKMERYGANILILPKTEDLQLSYGGINLGGVSFDMGQIRQADLQRLAHDQERGQHRRHRPDPAWRGRPPTTRRCCLPGST